MKSTNSLVATLVVCLFLAPTVWAQAPASENQSAASPAQRVSAAEVPRLIKFSGTLLDAQERPLAGPVGVTFTLYAQQAGGAALWLESQNVKPDGNGNYTVLLGANSANGVPAELFTSGEARWLGIQVGQQPERERILLVSVPYALKAGDAETLGGLPASAFVTNGTPGSTGNSGGAAAATSSSSTALPKSSTAATPKQAASTPQPATPCSSLTSDGAATVNSIAVFTTACNVESSVITQASGNVGIGTATPAVAVDVVGNNAGLRLSGTGTHQVTVTGATSGRLGQDANGFFFASDTNGKSVRFLTNNGTLNEWMRITSAGNIGIGTTTPVAKLDINGNLNLPNTTTTTGVISLGGTSFAHNFGGNTFLGASAGNFAMTGNLNTATGESTLRSNTTGFGNTASGASALASNTTGHNNTAVGYPALTSNTDGISNTAIGSFALSANTSGADNMAAGSGALESNTLGGSNTAIGQAALRDNTTGSNNTALGFLAGATFTFANTNTTGSINTFIGYGSGPGTPTQLTNATAIGANALVNCSNCMVLGGTGANAVNVGIGTAAPSFTLDVAGAGNFSGNTANQIVNVSQNGAGGALLASTSSASTGSFLTGVAIQAQATNPSGCAGVIGLLGAPSSAPCAGVAGASGNTTAAVAGRATATSGTTLGVSGVATASPNGIGVEGLGAGIGVHGFSSTGVAGQFDGNVNVTGTLTKGSGTFKIDHPLDPANKYLYHSFVESPDMMNIYDGIVMLDKKGEAWVNLPDWFEALNRDFRYQLTAIGAPQANLYIKNEISGNRFKIAGGKRGGKVSWLVTGVRQDAYAKAHPISVEQDKPPQEQGYYLHPEVFGQPATKSVSAARTRAVPTPSSSTSENVTSGGKTP